METILLIDDEAMVLESLSRGLTRSGFSVISSESAQGGVQLARDRLPDLILCDVMMPSMDGYCALTALKELPSTSNIPVILMTGAADRNGLRQGMGLGAADYLPKPFTIQEMLKAVQARLEQKKTLTLLSEIEVSNVRTTLTTALPHELLTPLNGIIGFSELLAQNGGSMSPEEVVEAGQFIHSSAARLLRVFEKYILYSQLHLRDSASIFGKEPSQALPVITSTANRVCSKYERLKDLDFKAEPCRVGIPEAALEKIIEELLDNACQFSAAGSALKVVAVKGESYDIDIYDHGKGMTPEQTKSAGALLLQSRQLHDENGFGLGLAVVKKLAESYSGAFAISSVPGLGTHVRVSLPCA